MSVRVGVVGPFEEDDFATNIVDGLRALGLEAVSLGLPTPEVKSRRAGNLLHVLRRDPRFGTRLEAGVVRRSREADVDLVITVISLRPETIRTLRAEGRRTALWFPDHVANLAPLWMFDAPYNGLFFKEPVLVSRVTSLLELPVHYLAEACNPRIHRPVEPDPEATGQVVVVGNLHPVRARLLERLVHDGVPITIYGSPAQVPADGTLSSLHRGRYLRGTAKSAVFGGAAAVLNNLHPAEIEGMNCRLFEAAAAGGAIVSEHRPALPGLFSVGTEILAFNHYEELLASLHDLIGDTERRRALGAAASRRALAEHTYEIRLRELLDRVL